MVRNYFKLVVVYGNAVRNTILYHYYIELELHGGTDS